MKKTIAAFEARRQFGEILRGVNRGDEYIVENHGTPVAVVVPFELYSQWERNREAFFAKIRAIAERANLPEGEAASLVDEAITAVRSHQQR